MRIILGLAFFSIGLANLLSGSEQLILCGVCMGIGLILMLRSKEE